MGLQLTDEQVELLGKSIGESFAKEFWKQVEKNNKAMGHKG